MKKFVNGMLLATMAIALVLAGCEDEKEAIPPTTVTLSAGNTSTDFKTFVFASVGALPYYNPYTGRFERNYYLIVMGANASDTLFIATLSFEQLATDSPIALSNTLIGIAGTLGSGQITAVNGAGASGTLTFTRLDTLGFVSGQFSDDATVLGIAADESEVTVSISGGFAAVGGSVDIPNLLSKQLFLLPSAGGRLAVPFE